MISKKVKSIACYGVAISLQILALGYSNKAIAHSGDADEFRNACMVQASDDACERWEAYDPTGFMADFPYTLQGDFMTVEEFAKRFHISLEQVDDVIDFNPFLLERSKVESLGDFNPWFVDFESLDELNGSSIAEENKWLWLEYRGFELGDL